MPANDNGKGHDRRPAQVPAEEVGDRYDRIFKHGKYTTPSPGDEETNRNDCKLRVAVCQFCNGKGFRGWDGNGGEHKCGSCLGSGLESD